VTTLSYRIIAGLFLLSSSLLARAPERVESQLAALNAELRRTGQTMKFYDAAIAATALARGDKLLACDGDYDRLAGRMILLKA